MAQNIKAQVKPPSDRHPVDDKAIAILVLLFARTANAIDQSIRKLATAGFTLAAVNATKAQIQATLNDANAQAQQWVDDTVPSAYQSGQDAAVSRLQSFNDPTTDAVAAAILLGAGGLASLQGESVQAFKTDVATRMSAALDQMGRSSTYLINKGLHDSVTARLQGVTDTAKAKQITRQALNDHGVNALIDRSGRRWDPEVYADNIANTYLMQARNQALSDALTSQGYDLVEVSAHGAEDACGPWEASILSLNGNTPGYYTVDEATESGLFHANCRHELSPVSPADYPSGYLQSMANTGD